MGAGVVERALDNSLEFTQPKLHASAVVEWAVLYKQALEES